MWPASLVVGSADTSSGSAGWGISPTGGGFHPFAASTQRPSNGVPQRLPLLDGVLGMCKHSNGRPNSPGSGLARKGAMSPRALVYPILAAVLLAVPSAASAVLMKGITFSPQNADLSVTSGTTVAITCLAAPEAMSKPSSGTLTVTGGTLNGGTATSVPLTYAVTADPNVYAASANWSTPAPGSVTVTCAAKQTFGGDAVLSSNVTVSAPVATDPTITAFTAPSGTILTDSANQIAVVASDPQGRALTYQWTSSCGGA